MNKERLKTLLLSILVVMSLVLTQQLWLPSIANTLRVGTKVERDSFIEEGKNVIAPKTITASFGAGDRKRNYYAILSSNIDFVWDQSKNILEDYFLGNPQIVPIEYDTYIQANTLKSIELEFADNMPTILISSIFDSLDNKIIGDIRETSKILIPAFNQGTIYIMENKNNIYKVTLPDYEENFTLATFIDNLENMGGYIKYHPIYSLFEELDENYAVMPINYDLVAKQIFVESEIDISDETMLIERSKNFFNENFDFVKTIKETNGATVYIYGYGEKSVRINNKGALEYNEEVGNVSSISILTSLDTAINFIYKNGGLPEDSYLKDIQKITNDQGKGYKFSFGYRIGGLPVEFNQNKIENPIEIEVYGNKIRNYRNLVRKTMNTQGSNPYQKIMYFPNIIESNIKYLKSQYLSNNQLERIDTEEKILQILKDIEEIKMVYFDTMEEEKKQLLKPSWMIKIKDDIHYFDAYTGQLINSVMLD